MQGRTLIRMASVYYHRSGYHLEVADVPFWAYALDGLSSALLERPCTWSNGFLCPMCLPGRHMEWLWKIGWEPDGEGFLKHSIGGALYRLGTRSGNSVHKHRKVLLDIPITGEQAKEGFGADWGLGGGDEEPGGPDDEPGSDAMTMKAPRWWNWRKRRENPLL